METLLYAGDTYQPRFDLTTGTDKSDAKRETIEISSDEDEDFDDGQPESSTRAGLMSPSAKRTITIDDDNDDDFDNVLGPEFNMLYPLLQSPRMKRPRLESNAATFEATNMFDGNNLTNFPQDDVSYFGQGIDFPEFTTPDLSFGELGNPDGHATLAFRNVPNTEPGMRMLVDPVNTKPVFSSPLSKICTDNVRDKMERAPYYHDPKLNVRMYCGPGYEKFPIVLGTFPDHHYICDEWDLQQCQERSLRNREQAYRDELAYYAGDAWDHNHTTGRYGAGCVETDPIAVELECLQKVREILPDIERSFALNQIREHLEVYRGNGGKEVEIRPNVSVIVSLILDVSDYPKQDKSRREGELATDGTGITIEWSKEDPTGKTYQRNATCLLAGHFDRVPTHFIDKTVQEKKSLFDVFLYINDLEMRYSTLSRSDRPYHRSHHPRIVLEKKYTSKERNQKTTPQWKNLVNELQAAKQRAEREFLRLKEERDNEAKEDANLQEHIASGEIVECQCCFDEEIPINRVISCDSEEMHWFCFGCISRLAENQVGSMRHEMNCMHQSGCKASLSKNGIRCAIPKQLFDRLEFFLQQSEISAAGIEGLEQCPFCDFKAICDPVSEISVFQCYNPDCGRFSCRMCHEDNHLPKSCEETKADKHISARHQIEEARSEAMIRKCPKCGVKIVKEMGCNKMRCGRCACVMCYVCQTDLSNQREGGYAHFNQSGAKCTLYDKDFDRHEAEADAAEKEAIQKVRAENADINEEQLQIETGKAKKKPIHKGDELGYGWGRALHEPVHQRQRDIQQRQIEAMRQHQIAFERMYRRIMEKHNNARAPQDVQNPTHGYAQKDQRLHYNAPIERVRELDREVENVRIAMNALPAVEAMPPATPIIPPILAPPHRFGIMTQQTATGQLGALEAAPLPPPALWNRRGHAHAMEVHNANMYGNQSHLIVAPEGLPSPPLRRVGTLDGPVAHHAAMRPQNLPPLSGAARYFQGRQFGVDQPQQNKPMGQMQPPPDHMANWHGHFGIQDPQGMRNHQMVQPHIEFPRPWSPFEGLFNQDEINAQGIATWIDNRTAPGAEMPANIL